ncbi:MAG: hypothetical protein UZ17_ACD001001578 [Acidobacteria bacterium OLB17]|nr:MAG: hypothetical protein UZ17_ACD001001578 [Acidobacteria bacterium OLB17]MCZ2391380.1 hypothetical protein [Acidobacteriota bacterium]
MSRTLNPTLSKTKDVRISKKLDQLLKQLRENNRATLEIYKDINKLKRSNEVAFNKARKAVESLSRY